MRVIPQSRFHIFQPTPVVPTARFESRCGKHNPNGIEIRIAGKISLFWRGNRKLGYFTGHGFYRLYHSIWRMALHVYDLHFWVFWWRRNSRVSVWCYTYHPWCSLDCWTLHPVSQSNKMGFRECIYFLHVNYLGFAFVIGYEFSIIWLEFAF